MTVRRLALAISENQDHLRCSLHIPPTNPSLEIVLTFMFYPWKSLPTNRSPELYPSAGSSPDTSKQPSTPHGIAGILLASPSQQRSLGRSGRNHFFPATRCIPGVRSRSASPITGVSLVAVTNGGFSPGFFRQGYVPRLVEPRWN